MCEHFVPLKHHTAYVYNVNAELREYIRGYNIVIQNLIIFDFGAINKTQNGIAVENILGKWRNRSLHLTGKQWLKTHRKKKVKKKR